MILRADGPAPDRPAEDLAAAMYDTARAMQETRAAVGRLVGSGGRC